MRSMLRIVLTMILLPLPFAVLLFPLAWLRSALRPNEPWYRTWPVALWALLTLPGVLVLAILLLVSPESFGL